MPEHTLRPGTREARPSRSRRSVARPARSGSWPCARRSARAGETACAASTTRWRRPSHCGRALRARAGLGARSPVWAATSSSASVVTSSKSGRSEPVRYDDASGSRPAKRRGDTLGQRPVDGFGGEPSSRSSGTVLAAPVLRPQHAQVIAEGEEPDRTNALRTSEGRSSRTRSAGLPSQDLDHRASGVSSGRVSPRAAAMRRFNSGGTSSRHFDAITCRSSISKSKPCAHGGHSSRCLAIARRRQTVSSPSR